ncbi:zinc finger protein (macronuclear) [Tetrahymena thermophila SB210]|uniref:Zinc finger protein n=1 Tax=Tetrahymena thermophila (strain SB210) TaxID=312017 RepID=Q22D90_TETTS|nr:zinc finger protein [Tetrahymena thermophila SB210]EAR83235.2 zinc finger protein [Tetrahymena thermophila SB210]|eukprot:XP_001030898.2 zinc finger protein [Tetrahymena thermophila SB210]
MNPLKITYILILVKFCISFQCKQNQIYSMVTQSCLQCSNECQTCFNTEPSSCITCKQNLFKSSNDDSACVQKCQINEFQNENNECVKCQVFGCVQCDENQKCVECDQNLKLDQINNQCILMDNVCSYLNGFIQGTSNLEKCQKECQPTFYQNMEAQTCEETINCISIQEIVGNGCTFALVDQNWNIINVQVLQNLENFNDLYVVNGQEIQRKSFIVGDQGGCSAGSQLIVVNFKTQEVVFQLNDTNLDYSVQYIDQKNQIVFLSLYQAVTMSDVTNSQQQIYIFDGEQRFVNQTIGFAMIQESAQGYQRAPQINTQILKLQQNGNTSQGTYQFIYNIPLRY